MKFINEVVDSFKKFYDLDTKQQVILALTPFVPYDLSNAIEKSGWDDICRSNHLDAESGFDSITIYKNKHIKTDISKKDISYSIVKIVGGSEWGTGFLVKTNNQILCITCNHVLSKAMGNNLVAISSYHNIIEFPIVPIKEIIQCDCDSKSLSAADEIAVLVPKWNGKIPFDINGLISIDDLHVDLTLNLPSDCYCYGYSDKNRCEYNVSKCLRYENDMTLAGGYFETSLITAFGDKIVGGYSGGLITLCDNPNCIIGVHEGRNGDQKGRMISCSTIYNVIMEVEANGKL